MAGKRGFFGTDGIRGLANVHPMTPEVMMELGLFAQDLAGTFRHVREKEILQCVRRSFECESKLVFFNGSQQRLVCTGKRARLSPASVEALAGRAPEGGFDARTIQPYFAGLLARQAGGRAGADVEEERVELYADVPAQSAAA